MTIHLGAYGIWQPAALTTPAMAAEIEALGFTTLWAAGPPVDLAGIDELLEATSSLVVGTSILNIWQGDPVPGSVLAPEQKVVLHTDPERARATARPRIRHPYLGLTNYTNNLRRLGFTDEDLSGNGSDRLIDALVAHGDAPTIARRLADHHTAGADHVAIQVVTTRHATHPDLPDVELQVYDDEVFAVYQELAAVLF